MRRGYILVGAAVLAMLVGGLTVQMKEPRALASVETKAMLFTPPLVPPPIDRAGNTTVVVDLETTEVKAKLANGVE